MRTILNQAQQVEFLDTHSSITVIEHRWSSRGLGNSKLLDSNNQMIVRASGRGCDRFGTLIGGFIEATFREQLDTLAHRFCKTKQGTRKTSETFYGLSLRDGRGQLDGATGYDRMYKVLNCIGFELKLVTEKSLTNNGYSIYKLIPVSDHNRKFIVNEVK